MSVEAEQLKNVDLHSEAIALASIVLPFPGGPYSKIPLEGDNSPLKMSGFKIGSTIVSLRVLFTSVSPLISSHVTVGDLSRILSSMDYTMAGSKFDFLNSFAATGGVIY